jgi:phage virion morphogenesis protein
MKVEVQAEQLLNKLNALAEALDDMTPFFQELGEELLNSTRARADANIDPDGKRWAPLSDEYAARKAKIAPASAGKILRLYGYMFGRMNYRPSAKDLILGTPQVYGIYHQEGTSKMPQRRFLGLSTDDENTIEDLILEYFDDA